MKKITAILMGLASLFAAQSWAESFAVKSPNGKLEAVVNDGDKLTLSVKADGKTIFDYACTSELNGYSGSSMCGIGTFCHEFGHVLGLPDYYHTTSTTYKATLEDWSIMDAGGYNNFGRTPPTYSVYDRFYLGWLTPEQINTANDYT